MLSIIPPSRQGYLGSPRDVVFVLDCSGSRQGQKMQSAARACSMLLETLGPNDRFAILAFDNQIEWMMPYRVSSGSGEHLSPADEWGIETGNRFLRGICARGGTELNMALSRAFHDPARMSESVSLAHPCR